MMYSMLFRIWIRLICPVRGVSILNRFVSFGLRNTGSSVQMVVESLIKKNCSTTSWTDWFLRLVAMANLASSGAMVSFCFTVIS